MRNINILPADSYTVINKTIITDKDKKIVSMLYQPIIGFSAVSLYYTLISDLDKRELFSDDLLHHHLMTSMQLKLDDIVVAREKLEAIGLLKTYVKKDNVNQYVYLLYSPLDANEFFNHPILNIVLYNNVGKKEYEKLLDYFKVPKVILKDYEDITASFDEVFSPICSTIKDVNDDIVKKETNNIIVNNIIDFNLIESSFPDGQLNSKCFNDEAKLLINNLAYIYSLSSLDMQGIIRNCINERGLVDKVLLRKQCRDYYKFENAGNLPTLIYNRQPDFLKKPEGDNSKWAKMVYTFENISPYQLLKAKYKGGEPTDRDKKLIEDLLIDQKLNAGVVNVLISYILKTSDEQLKKSYVETIAGQWKRAGIETVEDAMKFAEKEHKKMKKIIKPKKEKVPNKYKENTNLPAWFKKDNDIEETTSDDVEEIDKILNELI